MAAVLAPLPARAHATTLVHRGLEQLTAENDFILQADVLDIHSYWNVGHTFIFTDVHVRPTRVLKGAAAADLSFTVMGGTVEGTTILVVGGADLAPGSEYVLFLRQADLPGAPARLTVRDLAQGVFDVRDGRAISQAASAGLLPDALGNTDAPGGADGFPLDV